MTTKNNQTTTALEHFHTEMLQDIKTENQL